MGERQAYHTVPVHLQTLFDQMDFIASAGPHMKPCFKRRYYVDSDTWVGAFYRWRDGESQGTAGNTAVRLCCKEAAQAYDQYEHTEFQPIILAKMMDLRRGIETIRSTYQGNPRTIATCTHLFNSILELDRKIPPNMLVAQGIVAPTANPSMPQPPPEPPVRVESPPPLPPNDVPS